MGGCGRPGRVTSAPAPPPPQPESRGFGGALSQASVESTDGIERCSGLEGEAKGIGAPGPRARLGRGRHAPWARPDSGNGRRAGGREQGQRRWFEKGTLAERLQCALRRVRDPLSTETARSYPPGAHRPTTPTLWSVTFRFPGALEKPRAY
ncbi:uncharacterized protein LOC123330154 isoform X3 [Bubalus bubalis]|uniref:uncharacterized protein LOC123330154 isoform X3 n=1 Tax=Bubalus bubalis TaxID=89462 RepID=UPI001D119F1E|nr:uncharacterized protein LOC123330154 isoform X3 [Bubalus bubalis]